MIMILSSFLISCRCPGFFFFLVRVATPRFDEKIEIKAKNLKPSWGIVLKNILSCLKK